MPNYDFRCNNCQRHVRLFYTYAEYDSVEPLCSHCGSSDIKRLISRVAIAKSEDSRLDSLDPEGMMSGLDEDDPRSLGRFMKKMSREMGEDMGDDFNEVVDRLEGGESPESIEESMPELAGADGDPLSGGALGGNDLG